MINNIIGQGARVTCASPKTDNYVQGNPESSDSLKSQKGIGHRFSPARDAFDFLSWCEMGS